MKFPLQTDLERLGLWEDGLHSHSYLSYTLEVDIQPLSWISANKICFSQALLCPWCTAGWGRKELLLKRGETEIIIEKKLIALSKEAGKPGRAGRWGGCDRQLLWTWSFWSGELWCTKVVKLLIFKRKIKIKATDLKVSRILCYHFFRWMTKTWCQYQGMCSGSTLRGLAVFLSTAGFDFDC